MRPFKPRLKPVARLRELALDAARRGLAEALRAEDVLAEQQRLIENDLKEMLSDRRERLEDPACNVNSLLASQRYEAALRARVASLEENKKAVAQEIERRQQAAAAAQQQVRVIEMLNDKARERHQLEEERTDNRTLDEIASQRHHRNSTDPMVIN